MPRLVKIFIATALIGALAYLLGWSTVFTAKRVEYNGITDLLQISAVEKRVGDLTGTKLARIEPRQIVNSIKDISWVADADVSRNWLKSSVSISVQPRIPIGSFGSRYIDSTGVIFDAIGLKVDVPAVSAPNPAIGLAAVELFASLPLDFRQNVTSLTARSSGDFTMEIQEADRKLILRFGSADEIELKIKVFKALVALEENKNISTIDVSAPHAPIVK
jgi:cell division septal protein FtsQ